MTDILVPRDSAALEHYEPAAGSKRVEALVVQSAAIEHYDPVDGVKRLARAETAERDYRRAKDATGLQQAVETKLTEQRRFILWYDQTKHGGEPKAGRPEMSQNGDITEIGLDRMTLYRWRRFKEESRFRAEVERVTAHVIRVCEAARGTGGIQRGVRGTGNDLWFTPAKDIEAARDGCGAIGLDSARCPAAQEPVQAARYFTEADNGLAHEWPGRVWLNPPYSHPAIEQFIEKLLDEVAAGRTTAAILLTHNNTDTAWFHFAASGA